jgi:uncharacterized membrane protein
MSGIGLVLMLITQVAALAWARHRVEPHRIEPEQVREASLIARQTELPGGWIAWLVPLAMPLIAMVLTSYVWETVPARVPTHYGLSGQPDRWVSKSWWSVNAMPLIGLSVSLSLILMAYQMKRSRRISASGEAAVSETSRQYFALMTLLGSLYFLNILFFVLTLQLVKLVPGMAPLLMMGVLSAAFVLMLVLCWRYAQRRREIEPAIDNTPDECWHLGLIYANRKDPAILVEQRLGFGYTLNFGRPAAWAIMALALAPGLFMSFLK